MSGTENEVDEKLPPKSDPAPSATAVSKRKKQAGATATVSDDDADNESEESSETDDQDNDESDGETEDAVDEAAEAPVKKKETKRERRRREEEERANAVPKDRNAKLRQQLLKKRQEAEQAAAPLTAGEIVDDAFARGLHSLGKWAKRNSDALQYVVAAALVAAIGYGGWSWYRGGKVESASSALGIALQAEQGRVVEGNTPRDEDDPTPVFTSKALKLDAAVGAYRKAASLNPGSGAAILARLGEAGVLLEKQSWDEALAAYRDVKGSALANADADVKARSIEGIGFALEGKGDRDSAQKAFKELETIPAKGFKQLGMYHQARLLVAKGENAAAVELIKAARNDLKIASAPSTSYLTGVLDDLHRVADPASAPAKTPMGGANRQMSMEEFQRLQQQFQEQMKKAAAQHPEHGESGDEDPAEPNPISPTPRKP